MSAPDIHLGSGLTVSMNSNSPARPSVHITQDYALPFQAEITRVVDGAIVREWVGPSYPTRPEALSAARERFALGSGAAQ